MSDIYNNIAGLKTFQKPVCRVAYTLNNTQPVICTIIDDHPLFYMDIDAEMEEEAQYFDTAELNILEGELENLKKEINKFDKLNETQMRSTEEKVLEFFSDRDFILNKNTPCAESTTKLITTLSCSRLAKAFLDFAEQHNVKLIYSSQTRNAAYDRDSGTILINPNINFADQILLATRELRRHWQHRQGALINPLMFHPDNAVLVNRVQVADLITSMIRTAWELQLSGEKSVWEALENSTMEDLARAFAREAYLDFRTINNGQAMAAVFEAWFLSERPRAEDKTLINQMLADHKGFVFELAETDKGITPQLICALGEMPFGKNYLAEHALTIMDDAIFTDIRDRANANFLWFIKFERSFRETEQELQTSKDLIADDVRSKAPSENTQGQIHDVATQTAQIVQLFANAPHADENVDNATKSSKHLPPKGTKSRNQSGRNISNIVYLRRWSGE